MGWLPHQEAIAQYAWADAFVFSSLRDTTGTVVVEALAAGLPVICLDHQGVHDVVTGRLRAEDSRDHAAGGHRRTERSHRAAGRRRARAAAA